MKQIKSIMVHRNDLIPHISKIPHFVRNDIDIILKRRERVKARFRRAFTRSLSHYITIMSFRMKRSEMRNLKSGEYSFA